MCDLEIFKVFLFLILSSTFLLFHRTIQLDERGGVKHFRPELATQETSSVKQRITSLGFVNFICLMLTDLVSALCILYEMLPLPTGNQKYLCSMIFLQKSTRCVIACYSIPSWDYCIVLNVLYLSCNFTFSSALLVTKIRRLYLSLSGRLLALEYPSFCFFFYILF